LRDDTTLTWSQLTLVVLLGWIAVALVVGTVVGRGIAFAAREQN
jgi:hypothetical protein